MRAEQSVWGRETALYSRRRKEVVVDFPLGSLGLQIKAHWKEHRPKMYAQLQREAKLEESVYAAQELTGETLYRLTVEEKLPYDQAWELIREEWAFLPSEED